MRIISLEEHFILPKLPGRGGPETPETRAGGSPMPKPLLARLSDVGLNRIAEMDAADVTVQVLSAVGAGADRLEGGPGLELASSYNDRLETLVSAHPHRFRAFAHLPLRSPQAAADELERAVTHLSFCGALVSGTINGLFLDDPRFKPVLECAERIGRPIYVHPGTPPAGVRQAYCENLLDNAGALLANQGFGWHMETAIHVLRLVLSGTLARYPGLRLIIGHMGETLPMWLQRLDDVFGTLLERELGRTPSQTILDQVCITTSGFFSAAPFAAALAAFGPDRILFSVDYPFSSMADGVAFLRPLPVSDADKAKIAHLNAERLLGIPG